MDKVDEEADPPEIDKLKLGQYSQRELDLALYHAAIAIPSAVQPEYIKMLLDCGADPNSRDNVFRMTPLEALLWWIEMLTSGDTALMKISQAASFLLKAGADPSVMSPTGIAKLGLDKDTYKKVGISLLRTKKAKKAVESLV